MWFGHIRTLELHFSDPPTDPDPPTRSIYALQERGAELAECVEEMQFDEIDYNTTSRAKSRRTQTGYVGYST